MGISFFFITLLHSEQSKLHRVLTVLSAKGLRYVDTNSCFFSQGQYTLGSYIFYFFFIFFLVGEGGWGEGRL